MRKVISYGGGVGSTGLICYLYDEIDEYEIVFVDHGADLPETYDYIQYIQKELNINIDVIKPKIPLYDLMINDGWIPLIRFRKCTSEGKTKPFYQYIKENAGVYLGITYDEKKRAREHRLKRISSQYPLVENEITRSDCIELISDHGLKIPIRSGCYFCPFQSKKQWLHLYNTHNDLFEKAVFMEQNAQKHRKMSALLSSGRTLQSLKKEFEEQTRLF